MKSLSLLAILYLSLIPAFSQIEYQRARNESMTIGTYGRVGVDWSFENNGSIGRRLNLNNMGSIGGRLEEQDYLEFFPSVRFKPFKETDSTEISMQLRMSVFSKSLSLFANSSTSDLGGLTIAFPELYVEAQNISNTGLNVWVGARLYRGPDVHIADHRFFNDYSGQGFGLEYKNTRFTGIFVSSTDTSSTLPPYFYLNIATGTPSLAMRQRTVWSLQHDLNINENNKITFLGEYQKLGKGETVVDTLDNRYNYPADYGLVGGIRVESKITSFRDSYNRFSIRYGSRIANGGDGGLSRTWLTFGAPDEVSNDFSGAYSISIVDDILLNYSPKYSLNVYAIYTNSKGGSASNDSAITYLDKIVVNKKHDFTMGLREVYYLTDKIHLLGEIHYSQRKDGENPLYQTLKLSFAPMLVPTGHKEYWARPQIRLVSSIAFYNKAAQNNLYSPYLSFVGAKSFGYYFGLKVEWWLWDKQ